MTENRDAVVLLDRLARLDIDAAFAYRRALAAIDIDDIRRELVWFWRDHERHAADLGAEIRRLGGESPRFERDSKGLAMDALAALRSRFGVIGALRAMRMNERLTNARYDAALAVELPPAARDLLERHRADERRHLDYLEHILARRHAELVGRENLILGLDPSPLLIGAAALLLGVGVAYAARQWIVRPAGSAGGSVHRSSADRALVSTGPE